MAGPGAMAVAQRVTAGLRVKPVLVASINHETAARCVDVLRMGEVFGWVECRRDPEDASGWRRLMPPQGGYDSATAALEAAATSVGWM